MARNIIMWAVAAAAIYVVTRGSLSGLTGEQGDQNSGGGTVTLPYIPSAGGGGQDDDAQSDRTPTYDPEGNDDVAGTGVEVM